MKKITTSLITILLLVYAHAQQQPARLIVRGDDMGYAHSGNEALIKCYTQGIEKSIEVIVPSPWFPEAVKMLADNPAVDVGIHLALTSEWDNVKWRPLTDCASLKDKDGYFYPMVFPNKNYPQQSIREQNWNIADVEKEFRAQIELALKKIPRISHISAHMGCTDISKEVSGLTVKLAKEYNININLGDYNVEYIGFDGPHTTAAEKIDSFIKMLDKMKPGNTYLFVEHPGADNEELRAIHHIGYEHVAADRQGVTDLFTSEKVIAALKAKNIVLISYKDLLQQ